MKQTVSESQFVDRFRDFGRSAGMGGPRNLRHLYRYLVELEQSLGGELELDVIAICCDYDYYGSLEEAAEDLGIEPGVIEEQMIMIDADTGIYIQAF